MKKKKYCKMWKGAAAGAAILLAVSCMPEYACAEDDDNIPFTVKAEEQAGILTGEDGITINGENFLPEEVSLSDKQASSFTNQMYAYLKAVGESDSVIMGHQNDIHHKQGQVADELSGIKSDIYDMTGSISGIMGIDTLSLTGNEFGAELTSEQRIPACADLTKTAAAQGAIITLSAHMPNFDKIKEKIENQPVNGNLNWKTADFATSDLSVDGSWALSGDVVPKIMPGGELNYMYRSYLDMIAAYADELAEDEISVLFRPFHENTGSWFWWGAAFCDEEAYKNLFRYTVDYLRDEKNVHNFIYIYSPGTEFDTVEEYMSRYPGDAWVDMVGMDSYHVNPADGDNFMNELYGKLKVLQEFADQHNKLVALTETGTAFDSQPLLTSGNPRKDWYQEVADVCTKDDLNITYFMTWANFGGGTFYTPYVNSVAEDGTKIGHEMGDNFINFYNSPSSIFAKQNGDVTKLSVAADQEEQPYGYIISPYSGSRILDEITLKAVVGNIGENTSVAFRLLNKDESVQIDLPAEKNGGYYTAELSKADLERLGTTAGHIRLLIDGSDTFVQTDTYTEYYSNISAKFNMEEPVDYDYLVDDFESYYGDEDVLNTTWTPNKGGGCEITPHLSSQEKYEGDYGLEFQYRLQGSASSEGWVGVTKALEKDWSAYDALQIWVKPDGYGQKLVIQITSNGEDFEVWRQDIAATTEPVLLTIPFSDFVGKNGGVFDLSNIERFGIWCNSSIQSDELQTITSAMYFDGIRAVNTKEIESEKPVITDLKISDKNTKGYTVTANVSASAGIYNVLCASWTEENGQDDIVWEEVPAVDGKITYTVSTEAHNGEYGLYNTHVYLHDQKGNYALSGITAEIQESVPELRVAVHVQNIGWQENLTENTIIGTVGKSLRLEAFKFTVDSELESSIEYSAHVQNLSWMDWKRDGELAGTEGRGLRLEALKIKLTGELAKRYSIEYRTHVQNIGWTEWKKDGETAGTEGLSLRVEALELRLIKKA